MPPVIKTLHQISAWGQGNHVQACINLLKGMVAAGGHVHLDLPRTRVDMGNVPYHASIPWPINRFGLPRFEPALRKRTNDRFLRHMRDGDFAWLWPEAPLTVFEELRQCNIPIVLEVVNTRVSDARCTLVDAFAKEGLELPVALSEAHVAYEKDSFALADYAFASSPAIAASLEAADSSFQGKILHTSYGAWMNHGMTRSPRKPEQPITVLFVGTLCIRKNTHGLLRAWAAADTEGAQLVLVGPIESEVERLCQAELNLPSVVTTRCFVPDLTKHFQSADVFIIPSLEEGDPQVTYEAASFGLPIIGSAMGGGRMANKTDAIYLIDPLSQDAVSDALARFIRDDELRVEYGARTLAAAPSFDWNTVGGDRLMQIAETVSPAC